MAVVWTMAGALAAHHHLRTAVAPAMFVAVWLLYVADRMMDYRSGHNLEARHLFHGRNFAAAPLAEIDRDEVIGWIMGNTRGTAVAEGMDLN